jgi:hypothetical protein
LHDLGRATDELVERFTKRTDFALGRLRDQCIGERLELGVEDGLKPTPTLFALRAQLRLPRQAAPSALLVGESMGKDAIPRERNNTDGRRDRPPNK